MRANAYERIMKGLNEAVAHARGDVVAGLCMHIPERLDVVAIRQRAGLSQAAFAARIGVAVSTLRGWEQGRRAPEGPARVLLAMLNRNPHIVEETLGKAA